MENGGVLTEADFERMATEVETMDIDVDRLLERARNRVGRPSLGDGPSSVLQVRLDEQTHRRLAARAENDHQPPSAVVRDAIKAWLEAS